MLFDLFACVDFKNKNVTSYNPFAAIDPYKHLSYVEQDSSLGYAEIISLHKRQNDHISVYKDDKVEAFLFGYCFPQLKSSYLKDKVHLTAGRVVKAYQKRGKDFLKEIKGSFSLLIVDKEKEELHVFTDPINVRPLYYHQKGDKFLVSTSLAALVQYMRDHDLPVHMNYPALIEYYLFEYVLNEETYVQGIQAMPSGGWLKYNAQKLDVQQYWVVFDELKDLKPKLKPNEAVDRLEILLKRNLDMYLFDEERTAIALTGGYDSRTNLALLGSKAKDYLYYSYGIEGTYDLSIPIKVAKELKLRYKPIYFDDQYIKTFNKNADMAIALGDGIAEASRTNYLYAFRELGKSYDYVLTGLFGSELIKHPTSLGHFINQRIKDILTSDNQEKTFDDIYEKAMTNNFLEKEVMIRHREEVKKRVLENPYVKNDYDLPVKYFYYLLMVGIRKYFMKEIKVERPFVENLHPFLDIEFIELLLQSPFPWIYHWTDKKDLIKSLKTHKFYVSIIERNKPQLANILSTHGYTPKYLLSRLTLPIVALQYFYYKKKIKAKGSFNSMEPVFSYFSYKQVNEKYDTLFNNENLAANPAADTKNMIKMRSMQLWMNKNKLKLEK